MSFLADFGRVNHRMHNKLLVMDNAVAIVGGRNIGDVYFGVEKEHNYRDMDVLTTGPIVRELSASFDTFWNSDWAIPVGATEELPTEKDWKAMLKRFEENVSTAGYPYPIYQSLDEPTRAAGPDSGQFHLGTGQRSG